MTYPIVRPFARRDVLVPTGRESAAFDALAIRQMGVPQPVLMENAGRSAAQVAAHLFPAGTVVGVVGAGNNGGDALVLLRTLAAWGRDVRAILVAERSDDTLLHGWEVPTVPDSGAGALEALGAAGLIVDGILGTGVRGAPRDRQARAIQAVNAAAAPVLAIDIPSGVDGGTGVAEGDAVRADVTVTFGAPKLGALLHPGRELTGRVVAVEMGFPPMNEEHATARLITPLWAQAGLPRRARDTHKNAVGRLLVVAGQPGMAGAAVMAVHAALRAGTGLVRICCAPENREILQSVVPEAIFVDASDADAVGGALESVDAVAAGPGLGTGAWAESVLGQVLGGPPLPTVVDADGLNLMALGRVPQPGAVAPERPLLLTPHPGEMARLRGDHDRVAASDRAAVATEVAKAWGCAVVFKGAPSLVAAPGRPVLVDSQSSSDLATAGMGDVLTGVCGGMLAQGCTPRVAGAVGLYVTGRAAALAGRGVALVPTDVVRWLPDALAERGGGATELPFPFVILDMEPAR